MVFVVPRTFNSEDNDAKIPNRDIKDVLMLRSMCTKTCERCAGGYCIFCSSINYDRPEERTFCLYFEEDPDDEGVDEDVVMYT